MGTVKIHNDVEMDETLYRARHSMSHVMAQAVSRLFRDKNVKFAAGPVIAEGFYYDFDVETPFVPEDLAKIETAMRKIIKEGQRFERRVTTDADAIDELQEEPYKIELIGLKGAGNGEDAAEGASAEVGAGELTIYDNVRRNGEVAWSDLCRGPHLPTTKRIPAFKLMRSAAAYWRGNEKNKQLQRIYGTAWESKEALEAHLHRIEEAERRDHRKLGRDLDLFHVEQRTDRAPDFLRYHADESGKPCDHRGQSRPLAAVYRRHRRGRTALLPVD